MSVKFCEIVEISRGRALIGEGVPLQVTQGPGSAAVFLLVVATNACCCDGLPKRMGPSTIG